MLMSKSRLEKFLYALYSLDSSDLPNPLSRIEELYKCLVTGDEAPTFEPLSRVEKYLMAILGVYDADSLPNPLSRVEVLLYKLAIGDDNLDDVKSFLSEHEELLAEIIRNRGAGGNIDIEYVLYTLSTEFNTLYNTAEKPVKSAILSGQTLVNVIDEISFPSGDNYYFFVDLKQYEINKEYLLVFFNTPIEITKIYIGNASAKIVWKDYTTDFIRNGSTVSLKVACPSNYDGGTIFPHFRFGSSQPSLDEVKQMKAMLIPYQQGIENWDIPYFEGMQSVKMPVLTTIGKNLFDGKLENGYLGDSTGQPATSNKDKYTPSFIEIDSSKQYCLHVEADSHIGVVNAYYYDNYKNFLGVDRNIITGISTNSSVLLTPNYSDASYIRFRFFKAGGVDLLVDPKNIALYESSTIIDMYEPYKSNILTVNEDVELRGIGDVQDELDCLTGELTERIGEVVIDGNHNIQHVAYCDKVDEGYYKFVTDYIEQPKTNFLSDKFQKADVYNSTNTVGFALVGGSGKHRYIFCIKSSELSELSLNGCKQWLAKNPITIQHELQTPVIKTVDLSTVNQDGNNTKLSTFNDITHVTLSSEGLIPEAELEVATKNEEVLSTLSLEMDDISTTQNALQETSNTQSENVDATMIATTEIYEGLL